MDAAAELGRNPISKHQIQPEYGNEQADAGRPAEPVSRDQILRHERGQGNIHFSCSADHVQDWRPYPVDPCVCVCVCVFFPFILDIKFVGHTSRGHTGGRSHRISHPPSFCGASLNFSRERDSAFPFPRRL